VSLPSPLDPAEWIERGLLEHPRREFLRTPEGKRFDYARLAAESGLLAAALHGLGVSPGDRVAVRVQKSAEAVLLYVACLRLGAVFVPINIAYSPAEVEYFLSDSNPRVVVVDPDDLPVLSPIAVSAGVAHVLTLGQDGRGTLADHARRARHWSDTGATFGRDALAGAGSRPAIWAAWMPRDTSTSWAAPGTW
jgi:malonyl-CoA/methylmalonyl-CoA synthetase